jgi:hypothetical protein
MKKLLIVGNDICVIQALESICNGFGFRQENIVSCSHEEALEALERVHPSHLIILEYEEGRHNEGADTWYSFLENNLIALDQVVVLYGFKKYDIPNYLTLPIEPIELKRVLVGP